MQSLCTELCTGHLRLGWRSAIGRTREADKMGDELSSNEIVSHCVPYQFGIILRAEDLHDAVLVEGHGSGRHMKDVTNLLHDFAFS